MRIILEGDKSLAGRYLGWARSKLFMLKFNMKLLNLKQSRRFFALDGINVFISSLFGQDEIRIVGEAGVYVFVADTSNHRIQVFDKNYNFIRKWGEFGDDHGQFRYPFGVACLNNEIYVTNRDQGWIDVFDITGVWKRGHNANAYVYHIAIGNDKIAVLENNMGLYINVYDLDFNILHTFSGYGTDLAGGLAIGDNKLYVSFETAGLIPLTTKVYSLTDYTLLASIGRTSFRFYDGASYYNGKYYGLVLTPAPTGYQSEIDVFDGLVYSHTFGAENFHSVCYGGARGLSVSKRGIFATEVRSGGISVEDEDRVLNFNPDESYKNKFGVSGTGDKQFYQPYGIAVMGVS